MTLYRETRYLWWMLIHLTLRYLPQTETLTHVTYHVGESLCTEQCSSKWGYLKKIQFSPRPPLGVQRGPGILGSVVTTYYVQKREKLLEKHRGVWIIMALWAIITSGIREEEKPFLNSRPHPALQDKARTLSQTGGGRAARSARHSGAQTPTWAHHADLCAETQTFCLRLKKD